MNKRNLSVFERSMRFICFLTALTFLCTALAGCAERASDGPASGGTVPAASESDALTDALTEEIQTAESSTEAAEAEPYDTYEAFAKFLDGLTDQTKIDLLEQVTASITVYKNPFSSTWPVPEENPDVLAEVRALGQDMIPYMIKALCACDVEEDPDGSVQNKRMLMIKCAFADEGPIPNTMPEQFEKYVKKYSFTSFAVIYYLKYMEKQQN